MEKHRGLIAEFVECSKEQANFLLVGLGEEAQTFGIALTVNFATELEGPKKVGAGLYFRVLLLSLIRHEPALHRERVDLGNILGQVQTGVRIPVIQVLVITPKVILIGVQR